MECLKMLLKIIKVMTSTIFGKAFCTLLDHNFKDLYQNLPVRQTSSLRYINNCQISNQLVIQPCIWLLVYFKISNLKI